MKLNLETSLDPIRAANPRQVLKSDAVIGW